jgi:hypothetical protein
MIWDDDRRVYLAGQRVGPGRYRRVEPADGRTFEIERPDTLPASLDGRVRGLRAHRRAGDGVDGRAAGEGEAAGRARLTRQAIAIGRTGEPVAPRIFRGVATKRKL